MKGRHRWSELRKEESGVEEIKWNDCEKLRGRGWTREGDFTTHTHMQAEKKLSQQAYSMVQHCDRPTQMVRAQEESARSEKSKRNKCLNFRASG